MVLNLILSNLPFLPPPCPELADGPACTIAAAVYSGQCGVVEELHLGLWIFDRAVV